MRGENPKPAKFSIALIGDLPYSQAQEPEFVNLMVDLDRADVAFTVHDGDFKGGSDPCNDDLYQLRLKQFNDSKHPFFYVFGDNEWTDCHRAAAGGYNPFERLSYLRSLFSPYDQASSMLLGGQGEEILQPLQIGVVTLRIFLLSGCFKVATST